MKQEASPFSRPDRSRLKKKPTARSLVFDQISENSVSPADSDLSEMSQSQSSEVKQGLAGEESSLHSELSQSLEVKPGLARSLLSELSQSQSSEVKSGLASASTSLNSSEVEIAVDLLRKVLLQVLNSPEVVDSQSKKLLDALLEIVIEMHPTVLDERDIIDKILQARTRIVLVFLLLCIFASAVVWIFCSGSQSSLGNLSPT